MKRIHHAVATGAVLLGLRATDMKSICGQMLDFLVEQGKVPPDMQARVLEALLAREREASTAIGHALAVPHVYMEGLAEPIILFARLAHPVRLGAPDGIPTRFVFLLLGPKDSAGEHLDVLANIARLMSDDEFRYEAGHVQTVDALDAALYAFDQRQRVVPDEPREEADDGLRWTGRLGGGLVADIRRRLAHYRSDFVDGLHPKVVGSTMFLYFACIAPAVTFGGVMADQTGGQIGAVEMLVATAICGVLYALFSGQPLIILGGTGPLLVITAILYGMCESMGLPFLPTYAWVGLWSALFIVILAVTDASALMRYFTRFTDEIFAALISVIFIVEAVKAIVGFFDFSDGQQEHDAAFLSLILSLGCFYIAMSLFRFRRSRYLHGIIREFLADFGPTIALVSMTAVAIWFSRVDLATLRAPDQLETTAGRPWRVDLFSLPMWVWFGASVPALLVTILVYLDQNITGRVINASDHKLRKGPAYHLDLLLVGGLMTFCSLLGLPWLVAATVRSLNHVRSLATVEERVTPEGETRERIMHVRETRISALAIHLLIGASLLLLPLLKQIPMAVLYGLFLYMGVVSLRGNQFFERLLLWPTDSGLYPRTHYIRKVPMRVIHAFTLVQLSSLAVLWVVKVSVLGIVFPLFIAALVPVRRFLDRFIRPEHLEALDSEESADEEEMAEGGP